MVIMTLRWSILVFQQGLWLMITNHICCKMFCSMRGKKNFREYLFRKEQPLRFLFESELAKSLDSYSCFSSKSVQNYRDIHPVTAAIP